MSRQICEVVEMPDTGPFPAPQAARRRWISVLAKATPAELERAWAELRTPPAYSFLRKPEIGLAMVRGRIGGNGDPFNLGEMTVTRCAVRLERSSTTGISYVAGRNARHAELAAAFDGLLQDAAEPALPDLIESLAQAQDERRQRRQAASAATKVEFFTMVRE
jgi:alpha-D-ribose 1-methylphosphonate 5-triphosphate synthase subunit PhnG